MTRLCICIVAGDELVLLNLMCRGVVSVVVMSQ